MALRKKMNLCIMRASYVINYNILMTIESIKSSLSSERLSTYLVPPLSCSTDEAALGAYLWNQEVSSIMGNVLHTVEISLRNAIYESYLNYVRSHIVNGTASSSAANILAPVRGNPEMWFRVAFTKESNQQAIDILDAVKNKLSQERKARVPANYISKLTLGFWVALVDKSYSINSPSNKTGLILWPPIRSSVFPNATRNKNPLSINEIRDELKYINNLRNRLAHHEPLWKASSQYDTKSIINKVISDYRKCIKVINWINPSMTKLLSLVENHKRMVHLCNLKEFESMMDLPVGLDEKPIENLLTNLESIDETRRGKVQNVTRSGSLFIKDEANTLFFTPRSQIKCGTNFKIDDEVRFIAAPPKDKKNVNQKPLALKVQFN
ncbi:Abi family protein [Pseudoalteromonas gelatinilytica]